MVYPGDPELSAEAQERVIATFHQVVQNLQQDKREEARIGLEFILRLDPRFGPAAELKRQLDAGGEIDLGPILAQLQSSSPEEVEATLAEAVDLYDQRRFLEAKEVVQRVLLDLPGHGEARRLLGQIQEALKLEAQVGNYLAEAREALERGEPQEAANFVMMAQALDPHHPGISPMLEELHGATPQAVVEPEPEPEPEFTFEFEREPEEGEPGTAGPAPEPAPAETVAAEAFAESGPSFQIEPEPEGGGPGVGPVEEPAPGGAPQTAEDSGASLELELGTGQELSFEPESGAAQEASRAEDEGAVPAVPAAEDAEELFTLTEEPGPGAPPVGEDTERIAELLARGQEAFDDGRYQEAIDIWSRTYLIDPEAPGVSERIDAARAKLEEQAREAEVLFAEAEKAAEEGRREEALKLLQALFEAQPGHMEGLALKERLERASGEIPRPEVGEPEEEPSAALPEDEDLFSAELPEELPLPELPEESQEAPVVSAARRKVLPWRLVAMGVAAALVVGAAAWLGSRMFAGSGDEEAEQRAAVERTLRDAQRLYGQGKVEEAIHLLEQVQAGPLDQARIARRITKYRQALAPPTPTPPPQELLKARDAFNSGRWFAAFEIATHGLARLPDDAGLREIRAQALELEPKLASWERAMARRDFGAALAVVRGLAERHPNDPDVARALERALFNAGVAELRKYNLAGGEQLLAELAERRPDDREVQRILEFIRAYKTRPVDMQLKIFIASIRDR